MAVEITGWGCPSFRDSVSSQYSLTRPDLWRSSWSWPYQYSRVPHYYCERLPFPRSPVSWSARIEMISVQRETSRVSADQDGQMWSWGEQSWSAVEARPKVLESMINGWSRPKRWGIDDQTCGGGRGWTKLTKYLGHLINSTECATRTADKDAAVLHSKRLNDSTLRGRWDLFLQKM